MENFENNMKIRGNKLRIIKKFYSLKNTDFVNPHGVARTGLASNSDYVTSWFHGGYIRKDGKLTGFLSDKSIYAICNRISELQKIRPTMRKEKLRPDFLLDPDDNYMTVEEYNAHLNNENEKAREKADNMDTLAFSLDKLPKKYLLDYLTLQGFNKIIIKHISGKEETYPLWEENGTIWLSTDGSTITFSSETKGDYTIMLSEWETMQRDIHNYIAYLVSKTIFKDLFEDYLLRSKLGDVFFS